MSRVRESASVSFFTKTLVDNVFLLRTGEMDRLALFALRFRLLGSTPFASIDTSGIRDLLHTS